MDLNILGMGGQLLRKLSKLHYSEVLRGLKQIILIYINYTGQIEGLITLDHTGTISQKSKTLKTFQMSF